MKNKKVLLNCLPPVPLNIPSLSMSVLKNILNTHKIDSLVFYWNHKFAELQRLFLWISSEASLNNEESLLLFLNYIAIKQDDRESYTNIKSKLISLKPGYIKLEIAFYDRHMHLYAEKLDSLIDELLTDICLSNILCFGFSANQNQWVSISIIAEKIKQKYPESIIIIDQVYNKDQAVSFLRNFNQFDIAIWGLESENAFTDICIQLLEGENEYINIPNLVFRQRGEIVLSRNEIVSYSLLNLTIIPDYSDYFEAIGELFSQLVSIDIETSRICNYNNNRSYYMNLEYRFKPINIIAEEIKYNIEKYQIYKYHFFENQIVENYCDNIIPLLDLLIDLKEKYPDLEVSNVKINPFKIDIGVIRKIVESGIVSIKLLDYTYIKKNILNQINCEKTLADFILLIKYSVFYHISSIEIFIFMESNSEVGENILQLICDFYYLRFFFKLGCLKYKISDVDIILSYKYQVQMLSRSPNLIKKIFFDESAQKYEINLDSLNDSLVWDDFINTYSYYTRNRFEYQLFRKENNSIIYKEFFNDVLINEFELSPLDWLILESANEQIVSIEMILEKIYFTIKNELMQIEIINVLEELKFEGLIYISEDYKQIISVINTNLLV